MQLAQFSVIPLADHVAVTDDNRANKGIWTNPPAPELRKLQSPFQLLTIRGCKRGIHVD